MKITTRGRYALVIMLDLAEQNSDEYVKLGDIAARQRISEKYLESIIASLSKGGLVIGVRGKGGGYKLARKPEEYTVGAILKASEGSLAPVECLESDTPCDSAGSCKLLPMWRGLDRVIDNYLESITLSNLMCGNF